MRINWILTGMVAAAAAVSEQGSATVSLTLLADNTIMSPYGVPFTKPYPPAVSGNEVLFCGDVQSTQALFRGTPTNYSIVAAEGDLIPGTASTLTAFANPVAEMIFAPTMDAAGRVASFATYSAVFPSPWGVFTWHNGAMTGRIDSQTGTIPPGGTTALDSFAVPVIENGVIAFYGDTSTPGESGIYTSSTTALVRIVDTATAIPGGTGNFQTFSTNIAMYNGTVVFQGLGSSGQRGIYTGNGGALTKIADTSTAIPSGSGNFVNFTSPSISSGGVSFMGFAAASNQGGVYTTIGGPLRRAVDHTTTFPGEAGGFIFSNSLIPPPARRVCASGNRIMFLATAALSGCHSILVWDDSGLNKIIQTGLYSGSDYIYSVDMGPQALNGDKLAFSVTSTMGGGNQAFMVDLAQLSNARDWELYQ